MSNSYDVAVIGAGAGGMVCAAKLKERGFNVCLVEKLNKPGKKLSVTGNGRCNLTNTDMNVNKYYSDELPLVKEVIDAFNEKDTISYLEGCGLVTKEKNGYVYPYNENAVSVVNLLQSRLASLMVKTEYNFNVSEIKKDKDGFLIKDDKKSVIKAKKVVLACGGMSALSADTKYNALTLIRDLDIKTVKTHSALCALTCKDLIIGDTKTENTKGIDFANIAGVRTNAAVKVNLYDKNGKLIALDNNTDLGEVQITKTGLSGIPVFNVSRHATYGLLNNLDVEIAVDFLPDFTVNDLLKRFNFLMDLEERNKIGDFFTTLLNPKLSDYLIKTNLFTSNMKLAEQDPEIMKLFFETLKNYVFKVVSASEAQNAQVTAGGVSLNEIDISTFETKKVKDLYIIGELLDADGRCGGYNLQWAFATGVLCAKNM